MLPPKSPLSTFRVMTISHACVKKPGEEEANDFEELSVVFRAGREGENCGTSSGVMLEVSDCIS